MSRTPEQDARSTLHAYQGDIVREDGSILKDGWLVVESGSIVAVSPTPWPGATVTDVRGRLILPGAVDAHVHCRSDPEEGIGATTTAAAAGGVTTVVDMPFDSPDRPVRTAETFAAKVEDVRKEALVDVGLYATFAPEGSLEPIRQLAGLGAAGFKVSTYGVDAVRFPRIPDGQLVEAFREIASTGLPVAAHQENQEVVDSAIARLRASGMTEPRHHALSRPPVSETEAAGRLLEFAHWTGARLHMVHGTVPRTFDLVNWHRSTGTNATSETCIQYLSMTAAELDRQGGRVKCNPPLRGPEDVQRLWEYLEAGLIDIVTSDHSPYSLARKESPDIFEAAAGMPGVATLLPVLYSEGVAKGRLSLGRFVSVLSGEPARIFGFARKGRLAPGFDADFVVFDPEAAVTVDEQRLHYRVNWSPYHGRKLTGAVEATYVRGRCVYRDGSVIGTPGSGTFVAPEHGLRPAEAGNPDQGGNK